MIISSRSARFALFPLTLALLAMGCAHQPLGRESRVVVLNFEADLEQPADRALGPGLADLLSGKLADPEYRGVAVKERQTLAPYLNDAECRPLNWQRIGRKIGVDYIVIGAVAQLNRNYILNTRLFDVRSGEIIKGSSIFRACDRKEDLYPTVTAMTRGIAFHLAYLADRKYPKPDAAPAVMKPAAAPAVPIKNCP